MDIKSSDKTDATQTALDESRIDDAWSYLQHQLDNEVDTSGVDLKELRRKIDWHIVPLMFGCYTMQFLDKVILNVKFQPPLFCSPAD